MRASRPWRGLRAVAAYFGLTDDADGASSKGPRLTGWRAPANLAIFAVVIVVSSAVAGPALAALWAAGVWATALLLLSPVATSLRARVPAVQEGTFAVAFVLSMQPADGRMWWILLAAIVTAVPARYIHTTLVSLERQARRLDDPGPSGPESDLA